MNPHAYRCLICGEVCVGTEKPSHCPFCGAKGGHLVDAAQWVDENLGIGELSDLSKKNLETTLHLEVNNAPFYRDAMLKTEDIELQGVFKYLSKVEAEHASVIRKILRCDMPQPQKGKEAAVGDERENLEIAHEGEKAAAALYRRFAEEATEPRVKKVLTALSEVESDHAKIEERLLKRT